MAQNAFQPLQGMSDLTDPELGVWRRIEGKAREVFARYGFDEIRAPILERADLFERSLGETTDVVTKEMYSFTDRGDRRVTLRPEGTAGVVRYVAGRGPEAQDARLYYIGPMFRAEKPQAGRKRQFHQIGVEAIGPPDPYADAECIALQMRLLAEWGLSDCALQVNTRGLPEDQRAVSQVLRERLGPRQAQLCEDCTRRLDMNIYRVLDCKQERCREIVAELPPLTEFMCEPSRAHFAQVRAALEQIGLPVNVTPKLVRGFDYYVHTVWEITHGALGAQDALSGGGRYTLRFGQKQIEGVGFAIGVERVVAALQTKAAQAESCAQAPELWLVSLGKEAIRQNFALLEQVRANGLRCGMLFGGRGMKAQMRAANKSGAPRVVIRGPDEIEKDLFILKDMQGGGQRTLSRQQLENELDVN